MEDDSMRPTLFFQKFSLPFPTLAKISKTVFSPTAASAPIERLFSKSTRILTKERNRLSAGRIQSLIRRNTADEFKAAIQKT